MKNQILVCTLFIFVFFYISNAQILERNRPP